VLLFAGGIFPLLDFSVASNEKKHEDITQRLNVHKGHKVMKEDSERGAFLTSLFSFPPCNSVSSVVKFLPSALVFLMNLKNNSRRDAELAENAEGGREE